MLYARISKYAIAETDFLIISDLKQNIIIFESRCDSTLALFLIIGIDSAMFDIASTIRMIFSMLVVDFSYNNYKKLTELVPELQDLVETEILAFTISIVEKTNS